MLSLLKNKIEVLNLAIIELPLPLYQSDVETLTKTFERRLKGLGHSILGNFSTQQIVRINQNIIITAPNYRRTLTKHKKAKQGHGWTKLERGLKWIAFG